MSDTASEELMPGRFFSPAFYRAYWDNYIVGKYPLDVVYGHVKLKPYRELWIGTIIAAAHTKRTTEHHYIGLPEVEPPDVEIVRFSEVAMEKSGRKASGILRMPYEIVRCSFSDGENIKSQIDIKNKPQYSGLSVAVYLTDIDGSKGGISKQELDKLHCNLSQKKVHPDQIVLVMEITSADGERLVGKNYAVIEIYPNRGAQIVAEVDKDAFFKYPEVVKKLGRGVATEFEDLGRYVLLEPDI